MTSARESYTKLALPLTRAMHEFGDEQRALGVNTGEHWFVDQNLALLASWARTRAAQYAVPSNIIHFDFRPAETRESA